ncbi:MAG: type II secretion system F family protein [Marinobacter sp.]
MTLPVWAPLIFIFIAVTLGTLALLSAAISAYEIRKRRLEQLKQGRPAQPEITPSSSDSNEEIDPAPLLSGILQQSSLGRQLQLQLLQAGLLWRPSEFIALSVACALGGYLIGLFLSGYSIATAIIAALLGGAASWVYLKVQQSQRQQRLTAQIPDMLDILCASLRSGHSFLSGIQIVCSQMQPPITDELDRVVQEVRFGAALTEALDDLVVRTENYDMELIIQAVQTQLTVGGNLAEVLDNIGDMIRDRVALAGEIAASTAEGRMSAMILGGMPFILALIIQVVSPGYLSPLFTDKLGLMMLGVAGVLMVMGFLIIRSMLDLDL